MSVVARLRRLRHGPLRIAGPVWLALGRAHRRALRALGVTGTVAHRIGGYGPFRLNGEFAFSDFEHWGGGHNSGFAACVEASRGARCVLDVGAHIGLVTLPVGSVLAADGTVYAFEPAAANLRHLNDHIAKNGLANVEVVPYLVGGEARDAVPFNEQREAAGRNSLALRGGDPAYIRTTRRQITLDSFCAERALAPEVIKIDVEGAEYGVVVGAAAVLREFRPMLFLSVHPNDMALLGHGVGELAALIESLGYEFRDPAGAPAGELGSGEYLVTPRAGVRSHVA